jgi:hypothetical protein
VRFKGIVNTIGVGSSIPVQVQATDAKGAKATATVTLYPFLPRVALILNPRTAWETWPLTLNVQGLGLATEMGVTSVRSQLSTAGCRYTENPRVTYQASSPVSNGGASIFRWASFRTEQSSCNDVKLRLTLKFPGMTDSTPEFEVNAPTMNFRARQSYSVENTWQLQDRLAFRLHQAHWGTCSGKSAGTEGDHTVGVHEYGGDIAFAIRSGPVGTECDYASSAFRLPDGFQLEGIEFTSSEGPNDSSTTVSFGTGAKHYCRVDGSGGPPDVGFVKLNLARGTVTVVPLEVNAGLVSGLDADRFTVEGWDRPLTVQGVTVLATDDFNYAMVMAPMRIKLGCVYTPSNTEHIRLRIKRVEFSGPPGVAFP